jgi:hypothetical protein
MSAQEELKQIDENVNRLYMTIFDYYKGLKTINHPKINLLCEPMDQLIEIKKNKEINGTEYAKRWAEINALAFKNINEIYDYNKQIEEEEKKHNEEIDKALKDKFDVDSLKDDKDEKSNLDYEGFVASYS